MASVVKLTQGVNDLVTTHPALAKEWHPTKNKPLGPNDVFAGTGKTIWWRCSKDKTHEWSAKGNNRVNGSGCPFCSGRKPITGVNDLATLYPQISSEWHPFKNGDLTPNSFLPNSHRKAWWLCTKYPTHEWETSIGHRQRTGCPFCGNRQVSEGSNDLEAVNPSLAKEWDLIRNAPLTPKTITAGSHKVVWWSCKKYKHSWRASIVSRHKGNGCPYCGNKLVLPGFNDLATVNPELAMEWDTDKNLDLQPSMVLPGSHTSVWWMCSQHKNHSWKSSIAPRNSRGVGCPICANLKILVGFNDFATTNPGLAAEWHLEKNGELAPSSVVSGSQKVVWWQCLNNSKHTWKAGIKNRMSGTGCPECTQYGYKTSANGLFYFIHNPGLKSFKVGITNPSAKSNRVANFQISGWNIIRTWEAEGLVILNLETKVLQWIRKERKLPVFLGRSDMGRHGGWSETFSAEGVSQNELIAFVEKELQNIHLVSLHN